MEKNFFKDRNNIPRKLTEAEVEVILKKFDKDKRINVEEHPEYFSIHQEDNTILRIPKRKHIMYAGGQEVPIEEEIRRALKK
jgi:hypothetical protein